MDNLNYGVIGNCTSAALVSRYGSIDWCCLPDFDGPSVFARLLDNERGGRFDVEPDGDYKASQSYIRKTNILATTFSDGLNAFEVIDFMPRYKTETGRYHAPPDIVRLFRPLSGRPRLRLRYEPRLGYAKHPTRTEVQDHVIKSMTTAGGYESIYLYSDIDAGCILNGEPIELDQDRYALLSYNQKLVELDIDRVRLEFERTKVYWMTWVARTTTFSRWREPIERSALVLKLLTYQKSGAILAAVTTSLPETIGEVRNWDYRYCWLRDASMTIRLLTGLSHYNVAHRFLQFILNVIPTKDQKVQIMYGINGHTRLIERELSWLSGYENSRPVRVGNAAYTQKQNDIYGVLMDVIYQNFRIFRSSLDNREALWTLVRSFARYVGNHWMQPDRGIWEFRSEQRHFTFSKVLCWVAMDRAVKIANLLGKHSYTVTWSKLRDQIKVDILKNGWNPELGAFSQAYGDRNLDAANLLMEHYGFIDAHDPAYEGTVRLTYEQLCRDGLMYRYRNKDDFGRPSSSFTVCTFWMIKSLYRIGEHELAEQMFEQLLQYSNHVGLFSEDLDFDSKRLLGNFPQGYSHLALIDTATTLAGEGYRLDEAIAENVGVTGL